MSTISRGTSWSSGQTLTAAALNSEFNNLINYLNNSDSGATTWANVIAGKVGAGTSIPAAALHVLSSGSYTGIFQNSAASSNMWVKLSNDTMNYLIGVRGDSSNIFSIYDNVALANRFTITTGGIVGTPYQSACRVSRITTGQSITSPTVTKVQFNQKDFDVQGEFDATTNFQFTATADGKYLVASNVFMNGATAGDVASIFIYLNGASYSQGSYIVPTGGGVEMSLTDILNLSANATVDIRVQDPSHNSNIVQGAGPSLSWLAITKVG
jgi:hypothetical protein